MIRWSLLGGSFVVFLFLFFHIFCSLPEDPREPSNTSAKIILENSEGERENFFIEDSTGNIIKIGLALYLPYNIDSIKLIIMEENMVLFDTTYKELADKPYYDTIWKEIVFNTLGNKFVKIIPYSSLNLPVLTSTIYIAESSLKDNHKPVIIVKGNKNLTGGEVCTLIVNVNDPDSGQRHKLKVINPPELSQLINDTLFIWRTPADSKGEINVIFTATDDGTPSLDDTLIVTISFVKEKTNTPPQWDIDTITISLFDTATYELDLSTRCKDKENNIIKFSLIAGVPSNDTIVGEIYSFKASKDLIGNYIVKIVALDPEGANDTFTIKLSVIASTFKDTIPPTINLISPSRDSIVVETPDCNIELIANDASGISSVTATMDTSIIKLTMEKGLFKAVISNLTLKQYKRVIITATDNFNLTVSDTIYIKYEPVDTTPPVVKLRSPEKDSMVVSSSSTTVSIEAVDESGIASVKVFKGAVSLKTESTPPLYTVTLDNLEPYNYITVKFIVVDSSANKNSDTFYLTLYYDPTAIDHKKPVLTRIIPATDSVTIDSASIKISVKAKDESGIVKVVCIFGNNNQSVTEGDSIYTATISNLIAGKYNRITFIATDGSSNANRETLYVNIYYDPSLRDKTSPVFKMIKGPPAESTVTDSVVSFTYLISDSNGVEGVYWELNGSFVDTLAGVGTDGNEYSFTVKLRSPPHLNNIVIHAQDRSSNHNSCLERININYNRPPVGIDTILSTKLATPLSITLKATDPENDSLSGWKILSGPFNGLISSTLPTFTYTPNATYEGKDSLTFTVSDRISTSSTGKIIITIISNNIAPKITRHPTSVTINKGQIATFTAEINSDVYPSPDYIRWVHNDKDTISGVSSLTLSFTADEYSDSGNYKVVVRSSAFHTMPVVSNNAILTVKDVTKPVITLNGSSNITINKGSVWIDSGATAIDDRDGSIPISPPSGSVNVNVPGIYTLTYTVTDKSGNTSSVIRTVTVVEKYMVIYKENTANGGSVPVDNNKYATGDVVTVKTNSGKLTKGRFTFIGWNTAPDGSGTSYSADGSEKFTMGNADVNLYAQWKPDGMIRIVAKNKSFQMGEPGVAMPIHKVTFTRDFWLDATEVTQSDYSDLMTKYYGSDYVPDWLSKYKGYGNSYPAYHIPWYFAALYCNARTKESGSNDTVYCYTERSITGLLSNLTIKLDRSGFRLPTEAEWEYACRAGTTTTYYWGNSVDADTINKYAHWFENSYDQFNRVGQYLPNAWGLFDMAGNVFEWCNDYDGDYTAGEQLDPTGPVSNLYDGRMLRGGFFSSDVSQLKSAYRSTQYAYFAGEAVGFRVCLPVK